MSTVELDHPRPTGLDPSRPLIASGNLRRRQLISTFMRGLAVGAAVLAVAVMIAVVWSVASRGAGAISWEFLTTAPPRFGGPGGGIAPALVGTGIIVAFGTAIAAPLGILVALHTSEFAGPRVASAVRLCLDLLNGLPSIVVGIFVFGLVVVGHGQTGVAASIALALIMLPLIARAAQESLARVPAALREAADALGVGRRQAVLGVILPSAIPGIFTGTILAVSRAAGETAPILFTSSIFAGGFDLDLFHHAVPNIPVQIFTLSQSADPAGFERAWGAALVLLLFILASSLIGRAILARSQNGSAR